MVETIYTLNTDFFYYITNYITKINLLVNKLSIICKFGTNTTILAKRNSELEIFENDWSLFTKISLNSKGPDLLNFLPKSLKKAKSFDSSYSNIAIFLLIGLLKFNKEFFEKKDDLNQILRALKKITFFLEEKIIEISTPIKNTRELEYAFIPRLEFLNNLEVKKLFLNSIKLVTRESHIVVEENLSNLSEIENFNCFILDKGYYSQYFINDEKHYEIRFFNPYILLTQKQVSNFDQLQTILTFLNTTRRPLILIGDNISKNVISALVLLKLKKKLEIVFIKYKTINFFGYGYLEDLAYLSGSSFITTSNISEPSHVFSINELGQVKSALIKKKASLFYFSNSNKILIKRRLNYLTKLALTVETENEKDIIKSRIANILGNTIRIRSQSFTKDKKLMNNVDIKYMFANLDNLLEEGYVINFSTSFILLEQELNNWSGLNLVANENFSLYLLTKLIRQLFQKLDVTKKHSLSAQKTILRHFGIPSLSIEKRIKIDCNQNIFFYNQLAFSKLYRLAFLSSLNFVKMLFSTN